MVRFPPNTVNGKDAEMKVYTECWDERGRSKVETKTIVLLNS